MVPLRPVLVKPLSVGVLSAGPDWACTMEAQKRLGPEGSLGNVSESAGAYL